MSNQDYLEKIRVRENSEKGAPREDGALNPKFVHLWQNKDGAWKMTRVISYDHHPVAK